MSHDLAIIGGGIIGLATCYQLLAKDNRLKILLLEKEAGIGRHQTGHNSGVIHSGIYYHPGSLKARNCRQGYDLLIDFAKGHGVPYEICGKVIVATANNELPRLEDLYQRGRKNGLAGLKKLRPEEIREREPHVRGLAGIYVPQTGIIDFGALADKLRELIQKEGAEIRCGVEVKQVQARDGGLEIITAGHSFQAKQVVCCAGLQSDRLARNNNPELPVKIIPFRGEYFKLKPEKKSLVKSLIYPVPDPAFPFLGVHFTRMINGEVEAGPNAVLAWKREGYSKTDFSLQDTMESLLWPGFLKVAARYWRAGAGEMYRSFSKHGFVRALRKLVPEINASDLEPGGAGVRAQACSRDGQLLDDFYIVGSPPLIHVCNAPSPAATASLAIGKYIADLLSS